MTVLFLLFAGTPLLSGCNNPAGSSGGTGHTVTHKANGAHAGSPPSGSNSSAHSDTVTVKGRSALVLNNHSLVAWNTRVDGSGGSYQKGDALRIGTSDVDGDGDPDLVVSDNDGSAQTATLYLNSVN